MTQHCVDCSLGIAVFRLLQHLTYAYRFELCYGHTIQNNPVLVRSRKANWIGPDQYYVG